MSKTHSYKKKQKQFIKTEFRTIDRLTHTHDSQLDTVLRTGYKILDGYIKKNKLLNTRYNEIKNENETFTNFYKPILQYRDNQKFLENKFRDQLILYNSKGYDIPNLTTKNNVIKYSPLILKTQQDIDKFYLQDIYNKNKKPEIKNDYSPVDKVIMSNNNNSDGEDDEKEGIKAKVFLDKCDELIKNKFNFIKKLKKYKSISINNWFQKDLYRNQSLDSKNNKENNGDFNYYDTNIFSVSEKKKQKKLPLKKEIKLLKKENKELWEKIESLKLTEISQDDENNSCSKDNSNKIKSYSSSKKNIKINKVLIINTKKTQPKSNIFNENRVKPNDVKVIFTKKNINNKKSCSLFSSNHKRNVSEKIFDGNLFLNGNSIKNKKVVQFSNDEFGKTSLSNKRNSLRKKSEENRRQEYLLTSIGQNKIKNRVSNRRSTNFRNINLKMSLEDFTNKNIQNYAGIKNHGIKNISKLKINNLYEISFDKTKYEKKFNI